MRVEASIRAANAEGRPALAAFLTAGYPAREGFADIVRRVAQFADIVELGVPFSDPMADGVTIQEASRTALASGVTLDWILELAAGLELDAPVVLMSYLNPLLTRDHDRLAAEAVEARTDGFIVPDLPLEESGPLRAALARRGLALVQLVTPFTPPSRRRRLAQATTGFLYAVTRAGTTGAAEGDLSAAGRIPDADFERYARELRAMSPRPVLAGFGIRDGDRARRLGGLVDGLVIGSVLIELLAAGEDPAAFLRHLRDTPLARELA